MPQAVRDMHKEPWQQEMQYIEQRRIDLLLEHQMMQMRSPKLQSLQDRQKYCLKDLGKWAGDSERVRNDIEERHAQIEDLGP